MALGYVQAGIGVAGTISAMGSWAGGGTGVAALGTGGVVVGAAAVVAGAAYQEATEKMARDAWAKDGINMPHKYKSFAVGACNNAKRFIGGNNARKLGCKGKIPTWLKIAFPPIMIGLVPGMVLDGSCWCRKIHDNPKGNW